MAELHPELRLLLGFDYGSKQIGVAAARWLPARPASFAP